jgi:ADP-ribose pyrophosphatase
LPSKWTTLASRILLANDWLRVRDDRCRTGLGAVVDHYYVVERSDFSMVVALTEDRQLLLVHQYKHGCGELVYECPAGFINRGEEPKAAALRELREETGYEPASVEPLATLFASPATMPHRMHHFLCRGVRRVAEQTLDPAEDIEVLLMDLDEVVARVRRNDLIVDAASVSAILLAEARLREGK